MAVEGLVITETSLSGFKVATRRIDTSYNWWFCYLAIYKWIINGEIIIGQCTVTTGTGAQVGIANINNPFGHENIFVTAYVDDDRFLLTRVQITPYLIRFIVKNHLIGGWIDSELIHVRYQIIVR